MVEVQCTRECGTLIALEKYPDTPSIYCDPCLEYMRSLTRKFWEEYHRAPETGDDPQPAGEG